MNRIRHSVQSLILVTCLLAVGACGGGGGGSSGPPPTSTPPPPPLAQPTSIALTSDAGDYIGGGGSYAYTKADAEITVTIDEALLTIIVFGDQNWRGEFQLPDTYTRIEAGTYTNLKHILYHDPAVGGMIWKGEGRTCTSLTGSMTISNVVYNGAVLEEFDLEFEQYCRSDTPALRGDIHFDASDPSVPPGPVTPPPAGLWEPAAGAVPAAGNYVYLESQPGDYVGAGGTYTYTPNDTALSVSAANGVLSVNVDGNERWSGDFEVMNVISFLEVGYYGDLQRYPFNNKVKGGLSWTGEGRGCNTLDGWFAVDSVTYDGSTLAAIELRFEQNCDGGPALNGVVRWDVNDPTAAPGPITPPPAGLWEPAAGVTPETGNFVYLESEPGDRLASGATYLYTQANSRIRSIDTATNEFDIVVESDERWFGDFDGMDVLSRLEVGYYGNLQQSPFHNPAKGGMRWSGGSGGCDEIDGWFVVDHVVYDGDMLMEIDLRFEQYCLGSTGALHGAIHWDVYDTSVPPGPVVPPPADFWTPAAGITPATGNFVYLESEPGDWLGGGQSFLYTTADALFNVSQGDSAVVFNVRGDEDWGGSFAPMYSLSQLEVGYYDVAWNDNPARGFFGWSGMARGCNRHTGAYVVDSVSYEQGVLQMIELRFELHCEGDDPAFYGQIRWDINDTTQAPGPVVPPPPGLWEPAPGATPETGNYVYLFSEPGDFIGVGRTYLYTQANAVFSATTYRGVQFTFGVSGDEMSGGNFEPMYSLSRLEVGYYGDLRRWPFQNPAKGGMEWVMQGRGCNKLTGWFAVDSITYDGDNISAIEMRFEQHCEGLAPALYGEIHWSSGDTTSAPGPVVPPPAGLWTPAAGAVPASGDYVYLESEPGDYIGQGETYLYTPANAQIRLDALDSDFSVNIEGDESWYGGFEAMNSIDRLEVGYYGGVAGYPFHNPAKGGLTWFGEGRGCNNASGWFVVDSVAYDGALLTDIELRFEQYCDASTEPLRGSLRLSR